MATSFDSDICRDFNRSSSLEWLDTNGAGAYAMGTVAGIRTRRYHSLLNAGRPTQTWLSGLEETLNLDGEKYELAAHQYPGIVTPQGYEWLAEFRLAPYPSWLYQIGEATLIKELLLIDGSPSVMVRYCCSENAYLSLRPFLSGRGQHALVQASTAEPWHTHSEPGYQRFNRLHIRSDASEFYAKPDWYYRFQYAVDQSRGLDFEEDLWTPGLLHFNLRADTWVYLVCSLDEDPGPLDPLKLLRAIEAKEARFPTPHSLTDRLSNAAEHFIFESTHGKSVIAGYPWFTDWGRDTFISLPGLFLARGRLDDATRTIENFLSLRRDGLIPNRITDDGSTPEYNSIDATLWLFIAVWQWIEVGGDRTRFVAPLREMILKMAEHCDPSDGLLAVGDVNTQLTWMDARVNGKPVTPRHGKAVEINALFYNALRLMTDWTGDQTFAAMANQTIAGFTESFWNPETNCLNDLIGDASIRPNQLFALSLPYPLVIRSKGEAILEVVERELLTPCGLRTLAPSDPNYRGRFEGGVEPRDHAYHQGTVWPWLFGPYFRACLRVRGSQSPQPLISFVESQLDKGCIGQLAEVFDGDAPQREGGCPAQAWSVAEILWLLKRELAS